MEHSIDDPPIATRTLLCTTPSRDQRTITVALWAPTEDGEIRASCRYQIHGLGDDTIYTVRGADRIQALRLVLAAAAQKLEDAAGDGSSFRWRYSGIGSHGLGPTLEELIAQGE